jgi:hypothetical protein
LRAVVAWIKRQRLNIDLCPNEFFKVHVPEQRNATTDLKLLRQRRGSEDVVAGISQHRSSDSGTPDQPANTSFVARRSPPAKNWTSTALTSDSRAGTWSVMSHGSHRTSVDVNSRVPAIEQLNRGFARPLDGDESGPHFSLGHHDLFWH